MTESISIREARKLVLHSQRLPPRRSVGPAKSATLSAIKHLGYIQIDTISVVQRAHHQTLWNRNPRYRLAHLNELLTERQIFEYWSHAAAYLPMRDFRFSLPRKEALRLGKQKHWYRPDRRQLNNVLRRIESEGPLGAKDFEHHGRRVTGWKAKPAKQALEYLFMQGDLMITSRVNFHKIYDLTERVLPRSVDQTIPAIEEYSRFLIRRFLHANGLGAASEISYLLKGLKQPVNASLQEMHHAGELCQIKVGDNRYFSLPKALESLSKPLSRAKAKILSPFDNLLIQRKRTKALFDFDYLIECYLPAEKRQFGYFSLPILWDGRLVARMDCRAEKSDSTLHLLHLAIEPTTIDLDAFMHSLCDELVQFVSFNGCDRIAIHRTSPRQYGSSVKSSLQTLL